MLLRRNLKTYQMFSVHTTLKLKNATIGFVHEKKNRSGKSHDSSEVIVSKKLRFQCVFCPKTNEKLVFSNSSGLKSVSEKLRFRDGLVRTVGLTVETQLRWKISPPHYNFLLIRVTLSFSFMNI